MLVALMLLLTTSTVTGAMHVTVSFAVPSKDKLPTVIDSLIAAVRAGELEELFSQTAKTGSIGKARKAA
jgi:hypothetical protein